MPNHKTFELSAPLEEISGHLSTLSQEYQDRQSQIRDLLGLFTELLQDPNTFQRMLIDHDRLQVLIKSSQTSLSGLETADEMFVNKLGLLAQQLLVFSKAVPQCKKEGVELI
ncbi:MAG: hypothetical protein FJ215_12200 [Ignavibacteria bacterium]|nr:hypothetical protein [Ignavibacteria bacterium]